MKSQLEEEQLVMGCFSVCIDQDFFCIAAAAGRDLAAAAATGGAAGTDATLVWTPAALAFSWKE